MMCLLCTVEGSKIRGRSVSGDFVTAFSKAASLFFKMFRVGFIWMTNVFNCSSMVKEGEMS